MRSARQKPRVVLESACSPPTREELATPAAPPKQILKQFLSSPTGRVTVKHERGLAVCLSSNRSPSTNSTSAVRTPILVTYDDDDSDDCSSPEPVTRTVSVESRNSIQVDGDDQPGHDTQTQSGTSEPRKKRNRWDKRTRESTALVQQKSLAETSVRNGKDMAGPSLDERCSTWSDDFQQKRRISFDSDKKPRTNDFQQKRTISIDSDDKPRTNDFQQKRTISIDGDDKPCTKEETIRSKWDTDSPVKVRKTPHSNYTVISSASSSSQGSDSPPLPSKKQRRTLLKSPDPLKSAAPSKRRTLLGPESPTEASSSAYLECLPESIRNLYGGGKNVQKHTHTQQPAAQPPVQKSTQQQSYPLLFDTHCHLDFLFNKLRHEGNWSDFKTISEIAASIDRRFVGCLTDFCDPFIYSHEQPNGVFQRLKADPSPDLHFAFGVHPHLSDKWSEDTQQLLSYRLRECADRVRAIGEMGLDYSGKNTIPRDRQQDVLRDQLRMALPYQIPIVIHCRDAFKDCYDILTRELPADAPLHIHCYTGDLSTYRKWSSTFPNAYFGLTPFICDRRGFSEFFRKSILPEMDLGRLLVETDSPYFLTKQIRLAHPTLQHSHPGIASYVVTEIANVFHMNPLNAFAITFDNARRLYDIKAAVK